MDLSIFCTAEAWISLGTLIFLEIVLGVDNIVFIVITTDRLPAKLQHIGRKIGLLAAMFMRCLLLCFAAWLVSLTQPLFTIDAIQINGAPLTVTVRGLILFFGGVYLIYKGVSELRDVLSLSSVKEKDEEEEKGAGRLISLPQAVVTIMIMDIVFSLDSVITAVGLANHLIIMIIAVITAVILMMVFIDAIARFINEHVEMMILALFFITAIGVLLVLDGLGINSGIEVLDMHFEKLMVYFAMLFCLMIEIFQMTYDKRLADYQRERHEGELERVAMGLPADPDRVQEYKSAMSEEAAGKSER